jgi:hypothetical protein
VPESRRASPPAGSRHGTIGPPGRPI